MASAIVQLKGGHSSSSLCVDAKIDGSIVASGGEDGEMCLWSRSGELTHKVQTEQSDCTSVYLSKCKEHILYASFGNKIKIYDVRNFQAAVESYQFNEEEINQITLNENERYLSACDDSGEIRIVSLEEKRLYKTLRRKHTNICATVCFRARKPWEIISGGMDCNLIHWDFSRPRCINMFNMQELQDAPSELGAYMVNPPFVHHLACSSDGKFLACALENGFISIFDTSRRNIAELASLQAHTQGVSQVHFMEGSKLLSGGNDCRIAVWDLNKINEGDNGGEAVAATNGHTSPIQQRNAEITGNCHVGDILHSAKINWMKHFADNGQKFVIVADQSPNLSIIPMSMLNQE